MKTVFKSCATVLALILCMTVSTFAQSKEKKLNPDSAQVVLINLNDDFELYGIVKKMKNGLVYFQSEEYGEIKFEESELNWFEEIGQGNMKYKKFQNRNSDHYFMVPSAFQLRKKELYVRSTFLLFNSFSYGINDHISVSGGLDFLHIFKSLKGENDFGNLYYLSVKGSMPLGRNIRLGLSAYRMQLYKFNYTMPMAHMTLGTKDNHLSVGYGQNVLDKTEKHNSIITAALQKRINSKIYLIGEYIQFPKIMNEGASSQAVFSYGLRYTSNRISMDFSLYNNSAIKNYFQFGLPLISCTYRIR